MTQEDKELLLKDLCARLPYGVKIKFAFNKDIERDNNLIYVSDNEPSYIHNSCMVLTEDNIKYVFNGWLDECKPYLRPMSSMTEEEFAEYEKANDLDTLDSSETLRENMKAKHRVRISKWYHGTDWLNAHHFDYRGLIEKGLAIEAPKEMYN